MSEWCLTSTIRIYYLYDTVYQLKRVPFFIIFLLGRLLL